MTEKKQEAQAQSTIGGMSRRTLCIGVGGAAVALALGTFKFVNPDACVRPPGAQDEDNLLAKCMRCEKCLEVCPRHVIKPAHIEDGFLTMRTPVMGFKDNYCDWCEEENGGVPLCAEVCPTGAIDPVAAAGAKTAGIGIAEINTDWCLAYRYMGCQYCLEACPEEAIVFDQYHMPVVINDKCNGCGACYTVCASLSAGSILAGMTDRAIVVKPKMQ